MIKEKNIFTENNKYEKFCEKWRDFTAIREVALTWLVSFSQAIGGHFLSLVDICQLLFERSRKFFPLRDHSIKPQGPERSQVDGILIQSLIFLHSLETAWFSKWADWIMLACLTLEQTTWSTRAEFLYPPPWIKADWKPLIQNLVFTACLARAVAKGRKQ